MTKAEYMEFHRKVCDQLVSVTAAKNADYTGLRDDPFANFRSVELLGICDAEQGFLTRMIDKFSRVISFVQKGVLEVKDESVEDTLLDLANYCILLAGYIKEKKQLAKFAFENLTEDKPASASAAIMSRVLAVTGKSKT